MPNKGAVHAGTIDEDKALADLRGLGRDARLWLMDRIGNRLHIITMSSHLGTTANIQAATDDLIRDLQKIGLFEMQMRKTQSAERIAQSTDKEVL
jgi:hypothetical protein